MSAATLPHGWNARDLSEVAWFAAYRFWSHQAPPPDRYDAAWSAAAEALTVATQPPAREEVLRAARGGIAALTQAGHQFYGLSQASGYTRTHAAFEGYWHQPPLTGWEDAVVDRIALRQVWQAISPAHRAVLAALAGCGDQEGAARTLGTSYATYRSRLRTARAAFRELWHEGETAPGKQGKDRTCFRREPSAA
jgi:hypothetical protein